jgi:hypothetical protein
VLLAICGALQIMDLIIKVKVILGGGWRWQRYICSLVMQFDDMDMANVVDAVMSMEDSLIK